MSVIPDGNFVLLLDASSYFHRAYHAATRTVRRVDGLETGAIISFCWSLMKLTRLNRTAIGRPPTHAAIIMDSSGPNFRHEIYSLYKANRKPYPDGIVQQIPYIPKIAEAFGIPCIKMPGWEADDIIATLADRAEDERMVSVIASSDKDLCQLVSGRTFMYDAMKDKDPERFDTAAALINIDAVKEKWGVFPWEMVDLQALMGDSIDNVPGVPKVGPKKGAALLKTFGTVEAMIEEAEWGDESFQNKKEHALILEHKDDIILSKKLVELCRDVPVEMELDDLYLGGGDVRRLRDFFMSMEAPQLASRL